MNGFFWGGVARGLQQGAERQRQREMLDLQKKRFDLEDKESKFKMQELERQLKARLTGADILERGTPDQFPQAAEQAQPTGDEFQDAFQGGGLKQTMLPQPASQERQIAAAFMRAGMNPPASLFSQTAQAAQRPSVVGSGGALVSPTGDVLFQNPARQSVGGGVESRLFDQFVQEMRDAGVSDPEQVRRKWLEVSQSLSAAKSGGRIQGEVDVKAGPQFQQTEQEVARRRRFGTELGASEAGMVQTERSGELDKQLGVLNDVKSRVDQASNLVGPETAGMGSLIKRVPGSASRTLATLLSSVQSFFTIDTMTQMKQASRTGATGFGQLSEKELALLNNMHVMLDQGLDPAVLKENLMAAKSLIQRWEDFTRHKQSTNRSVLQGGTTSPQPTGQGRLVPLQR